MATFDEELAHTATAPNSPKSAAPELGATLGRYRLERMLGEGGMGVVHAAFDPDLERRVALKVLRTTNVGGDARQRLLREARAMARLTHENVVVVHEVGTVGDRDYVAMELIDGSTLAEWLAAKPRTVFEIVEAFVRAGRGLAAAHAAGLVHRDFKPHNVLRRKDGKIVVTDFGLARGVEDAQAVALDVTLRPDANQPSGLSGITATGSVLGTPAYMAPEQWTGGIVGAAADQFGFCVALWEALTGARPFKGDSIEELKAEVRRGPAELDVSKLPRRLRKILVRGLDTDPANRFPTMDALLAALRSSERKAGLAFAAGGGAIAAIVIAFFALHHRGPSCDPPAIDPGKVWSEAFAKDMPPALSELFNAQINHWAVARASACTAEPIVRPQQLHCLDGALQRIDLVRRVYGPSKNVDEEDVAQALVDPAVCLVPSPPRLVLKPTPDVVAAYELSRKYDEGGAQVDTDKTLASAQALANKPNIDPCAKSLALYAVEKSGTDYPARHTAMSDAIAMVEQCDDDRLRADLLLAAISYQLEVPMIGARGIAAIKRADVAVQRVAEPALNARLDFIRGLVASQASNWKEALALSDHNIETFENLNQPRATINVVLEQIELRFSRSLVEDYKAVSALVTRWLPIARALKGQEGDSKLVLKLEKDRAFVRYWSEDIAGGHADLVRLWKPSTTKGVRIEGDVVDAKGRPVAGATVAAGSVLIMDSIGYLPNVRWHQGDGNLRVATSDANGHFVILDCAEHGAIIAQLTDRRSGASTIADHVKLVLEPTRLISGKVVLGGRDHTITAVGAGPPGNHRVDFGQMAPVGADGAFSIDGVSQNKIEVSLVVERDLEKLFSSTIVNAGSDPVTNLVLDPGGSVRKVDVIGRSTLSVPLEGVQLFMLPGRYNFTNAGQFNSQSYPGLSILFGKHPAGESIPKNLAKVFRPGDLVAEFTGVPEGEITICAFGIMGDMQDRKEREKLMAHLDELELHCETVNGQATIAVVATAPQKSFD